MFFEIWKKNVKYVFSNTACKAIDMACKAVCRLTEVQNEYVSYLITHFYTRIFLPHNVQQNPASAYLI